MVKITTLGPSPGSKVTVSFERVSTSAKEGASAPIAISSATTAKQLNVIRVPEASFFSSGFSFLSRLLEQPRQFLEKRVSFDAAVHGMEHLTVAVGDDRLWNPLVNVPAGSQLGGVSDVKDIEIVDFLLVQHFRHAGEDRVRFVRHRVVERDADENDPLVHLAIEAGKILQLGHAGDAPGGPEVDDDQVGSRRKPGKKIVRTPALQNLGIRAAGGSETERRETARIGEPDVLKRSLPSNRTNNAPVNLIRYETETLHIGDHDEYDAGPRSETPFKCRQSTII